MWKTFFLYLFADEKIIFRAVIFIIFPIVKSCSLNYSWIEFYHLNSVIIMRAQHSILRKRVRPCNYVIFTAFIKYVSVIYKNISKIFPDSNLFLDFSGPAPLFCLYTCVYWNSIISGRWFFVGWRGLTTALVLRMVDFLSGRWVSRP